MTSGTKVVGYVRVSTDRQGDSGLGLDAQRQAIRDECQRRGWQLAAIHEDILSGKTMQRPELQAALEQCRTGQAAGIVVAKLDRLSRSIIDFAGIAAEAREGGWNIVALDLGVDFSTPSGEFFATMMAAMAQWEVRLISQRTREGIAAKRVREPGWKPGRPSGVSPALRAQILGYRTAGWTLSKIASRLNGDGVPTAQGGDRWHPSTVKAILDADRVLA